MALPVSFLDDLRARTPMVGLVSRRVHLTRAGRQQKGCCPFHDERTPSFFVYDDHFHCFGCGAHGDAIAYVMASTGADFREAVATLAAEAGLEVPTDPEQRAIHRRQHDAISALTMAQGVFQRWLYQPGGKPALDYLRGRGLSDDTIATWGIGWSGEGRGGLARELASEGIASAMLVEVGLMGGDEKPFDLFYHRVMFPIRDRRGRVVSFGGRVLGDGQPKYLNGSETPLFAKRRVLYGLDVAREAVHSGAPLVVVEGYLDVISMHQAGFGGAVAPLGSALTAEHLDELWRVSPAPVLCFDGDGAGVRAAGRALETALPGVQPDRTLRVVRLPAGEDPDSLCRHHGADAMRTALAGALSLSVALYDLLRSGAEVDTPEGKAAFRSRLVGAANAVAAHDKSLASEYRRSLLDRYYGEFRPWRQGPGNVILLGAPKVRRDVGGAYHVRVILAVLLHHPDLIEQAELALTDIPLPAPLAGLWAAMREWSADETWPTAEGLRACLDASALGGAVDSVLAPDGLLPSYCHGDYAAAERGLWSEIALCADMDRIEAEVEAAGADVVATGCERAQARLLALLDVRNRMLAGEVSQVAGS